MRCLPPKTVRKVHKILRGQKRVISLAQGRDAGLTRNFMKNRARSRRWRRLYRGIYATVTGDLPREAQLRAALLRAGNGAVLSHQTAAEVHKLVDKPSSVIHITVPHRRNPARCGKIPGVRIHRSDLDETRLANTTLPCTGLADTVIDLINQSETFDRAYYWVCKALGGWHITPDRLLAGMKECKKVRFRRELAIVLLTATGVMSWAELRYVTGVEEPHGLCASERQVRVRQDTGNTYMDFAYRLYKFCLEVDGAVAHPEDEQWKDKRRDRWNLVHAQTPTMRIGVPDLLTDEDMCATAADVAAVLNARGPAIGYSCSRPGCPVPDYAPKLQSERIVSAVASSSREAPNAVTCSMKRRSETPRALAPAVDEDEHGGAGPCCPGEATPRTPRGAGVVVHVQPVAGVITVGAVAVDRWGGVADLLVERTQQPPHQRDLGRDVLRVGFPEPR